MLGRTTRAAPWFTLLSLAGLTAALGGLASCSSDEPPPAPTADAGPLATGDASEASIITTDAGVEAGTSCDVGVLPIMPPLTSEVFIEGTDGGVAPAPTGGDEVGIWTYTKISIYLPPQANGQIDPKESKIEGKGFIELGGGKLRQLVETSTVLATAAVGKVTRAGTTKATGTYVVSGSTSVTLTITCRESTGEASSLGEVGFSRIDTLHARLHLTTQTQIGSAKLVIDLQRQP